MRDNVNSPAHYTQGEIECIDAMRAQASTEELRGYLRLQVVKYIWRCNDKAATVEDLRKARWYLDRLIEDHVGGGS